MQRRIAIGLLVLAAGQSTSFNPKSFAQEQVEAQQSESARKVTSRVAPVYSDLARRMNVAGTVHVVAIVAPSGKVTRTEVVGGNPLLVQAAVDAIGKWKWDAAPVETRELVEIRFKRYK
jgi:TonB family protein